MPISSFRMIRLHFSLALAASLIAALLGLFSAPTTPGREPALPKRKVKVDHAIDRGLEWLALHQSADGHWSLHQFNKHAREKPLPEGKTFTCNCSTDCKMQKDIAATAFGVLPFLGAGHGPQPSDKNPDYSKTVGAALKYLLARQAKDGSFSQDMYEHGLASRALCEAYTLTKDKELKGPAQKALDFITEAQDPKGGGWRYAPKQIGDLSVTGWQFQALKRGESAGLKVPKETLERANRFVHSCESSEKGGYSYIPSNGENESITMTAVGLLCQQYYRVNPRDPGMLAGVRRLKAYPPRHMENIYYQYYASQVMYNLQGENWEFWRLGPDKSGKDGINAVLIRKQEDGRDAEHDHQKGSWFKETSSPGGRMMATSMALLILELRTHDPLYPRDLPKQDK